MTIALDDSNCENEDNPNSLYIKLFEFVEDIIKVTNETREIYGYKTKRDWIPKLLKKIYE